MKETIPSTAMLSNDEIMILHDGGSLAAFKDKGNLTHYVETLYNPNNYFRKAHILVFDRADLSVQLNNPSLRVHYLHNLSFGKNAGRLGRYIGRGLSLVVMLFQAARIVRREHVTIIRARNAYLAGFLAVMAGKLTGVPVVVSLGGDNRIAQQLLGRYYTYSRIISFRLEEFSLRNADCVFCTNEFTRRYAVRLGVLEEKTRVVPHRIDLGLIGTEDESSARRELGFGDHPMVLFIGRFERDKQVDVVIEAIPAILQSHPQTVFVFVGDGSMRRELESRCRELGIVSSVIFAGYQSRPSIAKYLAAATIVWIPMSGFVIYEAAVARKAIVAFDVEWHSEFIENGVTGVLVKNRDVTQLAIEVIKLMDNPDYAHLLGVNAKRRFHEEMDNDVLMNKEIQEYKEVISLKKLKNS